MASNNPSTYNVRTTLKNLFSHLSECRRIALRVLPPDFFVVFFNRVVNAVKVDSNYRDLIVQAYEQRVQHSSNAHIAQKDVVDVTIELLERTLEDYDVGYKEPIIQAYKEFLSKSWYTLVILYNTVKNIPNKH